MRLPLHLITASATLLTLSTASPLPTDQLTFSSSTPATLVTPLSLLTSIWHTSLDVFTPRLVQVAHNVEPHWDLPLLLRWRGIKFADVTDHEQLGVSLRQVDALAAEENPFPSKLSYQSEVKKVHSNISIAGPRENIQKFTSFRTRYYKSQTGRDSQVWLQAHLQSLVDAHQQQPHDAGENGRITVSEFTHPWPQSSLIVHIPASNQTAAKSNGRIIVSSHQDSVNLLLPIFPAPGADDDGSGTVTQIESLRALLASGWRPEFRDVEWHFYSAEEAGLLGSQAVVEDYVKRGVKVDAMSQFDMTAFVPASQKDAEHPAMGLVTDFVSPHLTNFNKALLSTYLPSVRPIETKCGYACSDHASWTKVGVHSAFTIENEFEMCNLKRIHTTKDTWDHEEYSLEHIARFSRLSSAFVVELSGWADK